MKIGKRRWVFADGDLPSHPEGVGEPKAHEALMVVNAGEAQANLRITLLFEDGDPKENLVLKVPARRVKCFRMDKPIWGDAYVIPFGQYALIVESDIPVVAVFGRLDRRHDVAYYPVAPFAE
jgi:hypothetical protein